jgi:hypothetical protein
MKRVQAGRRRLVLMVIAIGVLAASVFAWGTEYKVSLYPSGHRESRHAVPFAKLLSEKERPAPDRTAVARPTLRSAAAAFTFLLLALATPDPRRGPENWLQRLRSHPAFPQFPCLGRFGLRGPPTAGC